MAKVERAMREAERRKIFRIPTLSPSQPPKAGEKMMPVE